MRHGHGLELHSGVQAADIRPTVQTQGHNIRTYSEYLLRRAVEYGTTRVDYVRGEGRLKRLSIDKGLLREAESVQEQIRHLLKCQVQPKRVLPDFMR
jgi:hypothetical protein